MANHEIKWSNHTVFSVESTEENKHQHHHCSTEKEISSASFPPFQEERTQTKPYTTYCTELEVTAMVCSNLLTFPHLTNETRQGQQHDVKSELSKMQRKDNLFVRCNPVCRSRTHASFWAPFFPQCQQWLAVLVLRLQWGIRTRSRSKGGGIQLGMLQCTTQKLSTF